MGRDEVAKRKQLSLCRMVIADPSPTALPEFAT
jgi:hypothetical protein